MENLNYLEIKSHKIYISLILIMVMIEWINFISLIVSIFFFCYFYTISLQPMAREEKANKGEKAWRECALFRSISSIFEVIIVINCILWVFIPIDFLNWAIFPNLLISIIVAVIASIPFIIILLKGVKDAGSESLQPSKDTEMYSGIYGYIRHPQSLGEFPLFIIIAVGINSWFLLFSMTLFIVIYIPIMIHYEEQDLIKRFGDEYREYQKNTGAIFPKIRFRKKKKNKKPKK
ncbi:MAG: isoprenylcysteine carboxylmethyltransferase family protein [Promethearchaeota archaeon]|nr:MAG: isoprenylcysteine carboxylmethyltransferase family protein [Candidatus Lokiarchaeota archaeon]